MYGLVNKALRDMVIQQCGEQGWEDVCGKAGADVSLFISNEPYPDALTYELVGSASERLGKTPAQLLTEFGRHWVLHTAGEGYGHLMQGGGHTLREFLLNLNHLHARVGLIFPALRPPRFECSAMEEESLILHHYTEREGLAPFVIGLIEGLCLRFELQARVTQVQNRDQGADHDAFLIDWSAAA